MPAPGRTLHLRRVASLLHRPLRRPDAPVAGARLQFLPGYGHVGWANRGSGDGTGLASRVGFHHKTLARFLGAIVGSGLHIGDVREFASSGVVLPRNIGLVAEKAQT